MSLKYSDITEKIIGGAMRVNQKMKAGYGESVYQKCMAEVSLLINFGANSLQFKRLINPKKLKQQGENPANPIIL